MKKEKEIKALQAKLKAAEQQRDYAYKDIAEYEEITEFEVNDAFRIGWDMARTTNAMLGIF